MLRSVKEIDAFKLKKNLNISSKKLCGNGQRQSETVGSYFGGITTLFLIIITIWRFITLYTRMQHGLDDKFSAFTRANHLVNGEEEIDIRKNKFLPSLELIRWESAPEIDSILLDKSINLKELLTYIEPTVILAHRNENHTDAPGNMKRMIFPMKQC